MISSATLAGHAGVLHLIGHVPFVWITSGKKAETRGKRIATACDKLACGKRNACCFDRSGMYSKGSMGAPEAAEQGNTGQPSFVASSAAKECNQVLQKAGHDLRSCEVWGFEVPP